MSYRPAVAEPVAGLRLQPVGHPADTMAGRGAGFPSAQTTSTAAAPYMSGFEEEEQRLPPEEVRRIAALMPICLLGYLVADGFCRAPTS